MKKESDERTCCVRLSVKDIRFSTWEDGFNSHTQYKNSKSR